MIITSLDPIEQGSIDLDPEQLSRTLGHLYRASQTPTTDLDIEVSFVDQQLPLNDVTGNLAVDAENLVPDPPTQPDRLANPRLHRRDEGATSSEDRRYQFKTSLHHSRVVQAAIGNLTVMTVERVLLASPRGFCAGVEMAIKALAWLVRSFEPPVYCYHEIVHNQLVVNRFRALGVVFVDDICDVPPGRPVMLSAHGSAPDVVDSARTTGGYVVDAVCPLVTKVHHEVRLRAGKGYQIVYIGHLGHEEAVGTMAVAPSAIHLVEDSEGVAALPDFETPVAVLAQTTLSHRDWAGVLEGVRETLSRRLDPRQEVTCVSPPPTARAHWRPSPNAAMR